MSETNYMQVQTCDHCHEPLYIVAGSPRITVWSDGDAKNYHFKCYKTAFPDTGDTAALEETTPGKVLAPMDDILDNLLCNLVVADTYLDRDILVADIKAFVAAIVQAEREACALLADNPYLWNTTGRPIAEAIRARSTPTPPTDA